MFKRNLIFILILLLATANPAGAIKYKGDLESNESITFPEQSSKPASPAATKHKLYFKDDGIPYRLDSSGNENPVNVTGFKNYLINGGFRLWQRGTTFTNSAYGTDRWIHNPGDGAGTTSRQAFTLGQTDVPGEPEFYWRHNRTTAATGTNTVIRQRVEGVRTLAGETATWSYWAKCGLAKGFNVFIFQVFGTGGSPSSQVTTGPISFSCTTSWARHAFTFNIPSITGKTIGTNGNDYIEVLFQEASGFSTFTLDIARAQLEQGPNATGFEQRPIGLEVQLAERYYQKAFPPGTAPAQNTGTDDALSYRILVAGVNHFSTTWFFKVPLRASPTLTYYNPSAANGNFYNVVSAADSGTPVTDEAAPNYVAFRNPQVSGDGVGHRIIIHATADAEL